MTAGPESREAGPPAPPAGDAPTDSLTAAELDARQREIALLSTQLQDAEKALARARKRERLILAACAPWIVAISPLLALGYGVARLRKRARKRSAGSPRRLAAAPAVAAAPRDLDHEARMDAAEDRFALIRVIGNDLVPRHRKGQARENLAFILDHEPDLPGCTRGWIVNRIADGQEERAILDLLEAHGQEYRRIPFDAGAYARIGYDFSLFPEPGFLVSPAALALDERERLRATAQACRLKNAYVMNNNGGRNAALEMGLEMGLDRAKWVLPWDGNCMMTRGDWDDLAAVVRARRDCRYFVTPMRRLLDNAEAQAERLAGPAEEEPQILFRADAGARFDPAHPYGRRPKVELLVRLGVPGPWDRWELDPWDLPAGPRVPDAGAVPQAGRVARLFSGRAEFERDAHATRLIRRRGDARALGIVATLDRLDARRLAARGFDPDRPAIYDTQALARLRAGDGGELHAALLAEAEAALGRGPFSVLDKTSLAPSGTKADYFHPAPYWWPDPSKPDGLPYIQRDGERVPGTELFGPGSEAYDRSALQRVFEDTTTLALAHAATGEARLRDHALRLVRTWFLDPATRMTPHLTYAQVRRGHAGDRGAARGVIEAKDMYFFLDAVRLLDCAETRAGLASWLALYAGWLDDSDQGRREAAAVNNHGICFDLQRAAIAAFLGDTGALVERFRCSQARLAQHFAPDGSQPHELTRTNTAHYCLFNFQCWQSLFTLYTRCGFQPMQLEESAALARGARWLFARRGAPWPDPQLTRFEPDRFAPAAAMARGLGLPAGPSVPEDAALARSRPRFHSDDGIPPYWPLAVAPERDTVQDRRDAAPAAEARPLPRGA